MKYFTYEYKKACNLGNLYLLPRFHKRLFNVPERPAFLIAECLLRRSLSFWTTPILVTADVVCLYPNIPRQTGLKALKEAFEKRDIKKIPTEDLVKISGFVLNNNIIKFNGKVYQQKSGTAIGTKFAPTYVYLYMDDIEQKFLRKKKEAKNRSFG